jgi:Asp-tRNA(Asn)/Glu-tRNA(Gln) amidotransferase A subunit family amidase
MESDEAGRPPAGLAERCSPSGADRLDGIGRRTFLKLAAGAAGTVGLASPARGGALAAAEPSAALEMGRRTLQEAEIMLRNGEAPALQFQAYPGGTGALLEKLWREVGGTPFRRETIEIEPWEGPVPATEEELAFLPVHRLAALVRDRRVTPVELTDIYLERLHRYDPLLLFSVTILDGRAREEAQQADAEIRAGNWRGPLHGIPWGVKDLFSARGGPTTWGSAHFRDQWIDEDAEVVVRLREAGAVLAAKLATGEFAQGSNWFGGQTKNPWNPEEASGGSSAGPGSATAAGCVAFSLGTETRGSIVGPSRRCGLSALRPTYGRVSKHGGMVLGWSQDRVGPMCRTIEDCALVFNAIHGADEKDPSTLTAPFRFQRRPDFASLRIGYTADAPEAFVAQLRGLGANLTPLPPLPEGDYAPLGVESSAAFDFFIAPGGQETTPEQTSTRFRGGRTTLALDFLQAQRRRLILMRQMEEALDGLDMYVSGEGETGLTAQTGNPAVIVPYGVTEGDHPQPLCGTIIGALFADDRALSVAQALQSASDWHRRRPSLA